MQPHITFGALICLGMMIVGFLVVVMWIEDQLDWSLRSIIGFSIAIGAFCIVIALVATSV
jgi:hypothetical protein